MKKSIILILLASLTLSFTACTSAQKPEAVLKEDLNQAERVDKNSIKVIKPVDMSIVSEETKAKYEQGSKEIHITPQLTGSQLLYLDDDSRKILFQKTDLTTSAGNAGTGLYCFDIASGSTQAITGFDYLKASRESFSFYADLASGATYMQIKDSSADTQVQYYELILSADTVTAAETTQDLSGAQWIAAAADDVESLSQQMADWGDRVGSIAGEDIVKAFFAEDKTLILETQKHDIYILSANP